ncbi:uncharacterized protein KY384_001210 [Bacidia gigantensis]|uniref:uncharacterized protein n=1 Tax=Bacidia gigantensis TaxID=2732470 RepID=UPI001D03D203|nr:uncharacterized protein KY384_001210 [Bacidia gigantensis]KAG8534365.1 hypothetical protein KY384_001210 [Bacidia gigantensis]
MDYSYFAPPTQPYQFFSLPDKAASSYTPQTEVHQDPLDAFNDPSTFQFFDQNATFDPTPQFAPPPPPPAPSHSPPNPSIPRIASIPNMMRYDSSGSMPNETNTEVDFGEQQGGRAGSSDDEKDNLTPAQSRRKAQNRAAQRAFRERKEKHVKELELKLKSIESQYSDKEMDYERLKRENDRLKTQMEILRATSTLKRLPGQHQQQQSQRQRQPSEDSADSDALEAGPMVYSPRTFNAAFANKGSNIDIPMSHRIEVSSTGERLLATGAAWDLIHNHPLCRQGKVDLGQVVDRLRGIAICDGTGPSFPESGVIKVIEESMGVPGDELI